MVSGVVSVVRVLLFEVLQGLISQSSVVVVMKMFN